MPLKVAAKPKHKAFSLKQVHPDVVPGCLGAIFLVAAIVCLVVGFNSGDGEIGVFSSSAPDLDTSEFVWFGLFLALLAVSIAFIIISAENFVGLVVCAGIVVLIALLALIVIHDERDAKAQREEVNLVTQEYAHMHSTTPEKLSITPKTPKKRQEESNSYIYQVDNLDKDDPEYILVTAKDHKIDKIESINKKTAERLTTPKHSLFS